MRKVKHKNIDEVIYSKKLLNGLNVYLLPKEELSKVYSIFLTNFGSNDITFTPRGEHQQVTSPAGVAHFLEHKLFDKGDYDVFENFSKQGASANAYTSATQTAYLFTATDRINKNLQTLLDFVQDPFFSDETVEREKGIIIQEENMYQDDPGHRMNMATLQSLFKDHPIHIEVLGTVDSINQTTKEDLYTCYETFYHPSNMTLFITGNIDVKEIMKVIEDNQAEKEFTHPEPIDRFRPAEQEEVNRPEYTFTMPVTTPRCMVGIKEYGNPITKQDLLVRSFFTDMLLSHLFGRSGKFYKELYDDGLIDHSFSFFNVTEPDFGYTMIGGNTSKPDEFAQRIQESLLSLSDYKLTKEQLERMKKRKIGAIIRSMNSIEYIAQRFVWYHSHGLQFFELIRDIQSFTLEEANSFIKEWIDENRLTTTKLMPTK